MVPSEVLVENLLGDAVANLRSEVFPVDDDLLLHVVLREPTSTLGHACAIR